MFPFYLLMKLGFSTLLLLRNICGGKRKQLNAGSRWRNRKRSDSIEKRCASGKRKTKYQLDLSGSDLFIDKGS